MNRLYRILAVIVSTSSLGACASIIEGTSQEISINTQPPGASCELIREDVVIGVVPNTPGMVTVKKTKQNINVICKKDGYVQGSQRNESDFAGASVGNLILGGFVGIAIDAASGATNKYDPEVNIILHPVAPVLEHNTVPTASTSPTT